MTGSAGLQHSLATMGFVQLALATAALIAYALSLNGSLSPKSRAVSGACALLAAATLAALTEPWTNGVILVAAGIVGIGFFVVAAWGVSLACGLTRRPRHVLPALDELMQSQAQMQLQAQLQAQPTQSGPGLRRRPSEHAPSV